MPNPDKVSINIRLWPGRSGIWWSVPIPGSNGSVSSSEPDVGSAVKRAMTEATTLYGKMLGDVDFQFRSNSL